MNHVKTRQCFHIISMSGRLCDFELPTHYTYSVVQPKRISEIQYITNFK